MKKHHAFGGRNRRNGIQRFVGVAFIVHFIRLILYVEDRSTDDRVSAIATSLFDRPGSSCLPHTATYPTEMFHPKAFMEDGPGQHYLPLYQKQLNRSKHRLLKVRFVVYSINPPSCRPIYYHIHKNGGSTMNIKGDARVDAYYTPREQDLGPDAFSSQTQRILQQAFSLQNSPQLTDAQSTVMPMFTFLRDPVPRFLSSVGQSLKLNKVRPCNTRYPSGDSLGLLECILGKIEEKESFLDEHLEPQAFELYHGMVGLDLRVQVMDMSAIGHTLDELGFSSDQTSRRRTKGLVAGYNLSMSILTPSLVHRICQVYQIDVILLRETRVSSTVCPTNDG